MKQRYSALDVHAATINLQRLVGMRLQNVYDVNQKIYLFKFAKPDQKELLLIESGIRIHTTQFARDKPTHPSQFAMKLRKHLRTRRLTAVRQLGVDRIIDMEFGLANINGTAVAGGYHVITEFYASGNIILTDHEYNILQLLRVVKVDTPSASLIESNTIGSDRLDNEQQFQSKEKQQKKSKKFQQGPSLPLQKAWAVGEKYDIEDYQRLVVLSKSDVMAILKKAAPKEQLKKVLANSTVYAQQLVEHCLRRASIKHDAIVTTEIDLSESSSHLDQIMTALEEAYTIYAQETSFEGFIFMKEHDDLSKSNADGTSLSLFNEFQPCCLIQLEQTPYKQFTTFDGAVDTYFSELETQKIDLKTRQAEQTALKKLSGIRREQESRVLQLEQSQLTNERKAQLIESNLELVEQALAIVRSAVANAVDWIDLERMVADETKRGNPIAKAIGGLKLDTNQIILLLRDPFDDDDADDYEFSDSDNSDDDIKTTSKPALRIEVDISLSGYSNARQLYDAKKQSAVKQQKTIAVSQKALKSAEHKIRQNLKQTQVTVSINKIRKPFWFEKFSWFISSEDYLVIAGHDMQQNDQLVKRHMRAGDIYVHADLHGAPSVIIKNRVSDGNSLIDQLPPPSTLAQAGCLAVCQSRAWDSKIVTSAWWVYEHQVSKTAPTGEYLTTGAFMIRGKKNFLPPTQLVYGFGLLFKVDESSIGRHVGERKRVDVDADADNEDIGDTTTREKLNGDNTGDTDSKETASNSLLEQMKRLQMQTQTTDQSDSDTGSVSDEESEDGLINDHVDSTEQQHNTPSTWSKYDLDSDNKTQKVDDDNDNDLTNQREPTTSRRYVTAKERREQRKPQQQKIQGNNVEPENSTLIETNQKPVQSHKNTATTTIAQPVRGKKGKQKKLKEKYADQDEEDRKLAMAVLGSDKGPQPKGKKAKREAAKKVEMKEKERIWKDSAVSQQKQTSTSTEQIDSKDNTEESIAVTSSSANFVEENEAMDEAPENVEDSEEIRRMLEEENVALVDADSVINLTVLDSLTGMPHLEDIILFALPVCAPYSTLSKYKYKVKLTPGSMKKGKASKLALQVFAKQTEATVREKEVMKSVPEMEMISVILGKVKVSVAQLVAAKKGSKTQAKANAKARDNQA